MKMNLILIINFQSFIKLFWKLDVKDKIEIFNNEKFNIDDIIKDNKWFYNNKW